MPGRRVMEQLNQAMGDRENDKKNKIHSNQHEIDKLIKYLNVSAARGCDYKNIAFILCNLTK